MYTEDLFRRLRIGPGAQKLTEMLATAGRSEIFDTGMFHSLLTNRYWLSNSGTTEVSLFCMPNVQVGVVRRPQESGRTSRSPGSRSCTTCTPGTKRSTTGARPSLAWMRGSSSKTSATMCAQLKCSCLALSAKSCTQTYHSSCASADQVHQDEGNNIGIAFTR